MRGWIQKGKGVQLESSDDSDHKKAEKKAVREPERASRKPSGNGPKMRLDFGGGRVQQRVQLRFCNMSPKNVEVQRVGPQSPL